MTIVRCSLSDVVMTDFVITLVVNWIEETELLVDETREVGLEDGEDACVDVDMVVREEALEIWLPVLDWIEELCDNFEVEIKTDCDKLKDECECETDPVDELVNPEEEKIAEPVNVVADVDAIAEVLELDRVLTLSLLT